MSTGPAPFTMSREDAERLTGGRWLGTAPAVTIRGATIDSRAITPGCAFACFIGKRVDGHDFAEAAVAGGAAMLITTREVSAAVPVLVVTDVAQALIALASEFRRRHSGATWIAVAGSNGKTTVKELIAEACVAHGATHATRGNYNNHIGLPVTVLATPATVKYVVVEVGANHPGENAQLAAIVRPQVAVVTSVGSDHLEGFGSITGVARASAEMFTALAPGATAILGGYGLTESCAAFGESAEACLEVLRTSAEGRHLIEVDRQTVTGSTNPEGIRLDIDGRQIPVALLGDHNLVNAAIAWHAARAAGVDADAAARGLAAMRPVKGRLQSRQLGGHRLIDDSYNANPSSMVAALAVLAANSGRTLAVLGHMGELGAQSEAGQRQVGAAAARYELSLVTVGAGARSIASSYTASGGQDCAHHDDLDAAVAEVRRRLTAGPTTILVKASRSAGLERVALALEAAC